MLNLRHACHYIFSFYFIVSILYCCNGEIMVKHNARCGTLFAGQTQRNTLFLNGNIMQLHYKTDHTSCLNYKTESFGDLRLGKCRKANGSTIRRSLLKSII